MSEAAIIGGGPAGAAAAILLGRAGRDVVLFEKEAAAHDKLCGEFISWEAADYLTRLGIDLRALGAQAVHGLRLAAKTRVIEAELPFQAWSLSRRILDEVLLEKAAQSGAALMRGQAITGMASHENEWHLHTAKQNNVWAKAVFLASGKHEVRGWRRETGGAHELIGFKMHFQLTTAQTAQLQGYVEINVFNGGYAGLEMVEDGHANLCFLVRKNIYAACGKNWQAIFSWLVEKSPLLANRLLGATPLWPRPLTIYNIPYGYIFKPSATRSGLFRLGDQMGVIPSFAGDGIAIALHSAFAAGGAYLSDLGAKNYHGLAKSQLTRPVRNARLAAGIMNTAAGRYLAMNLLQLFPALTSGAIQSKRLSHRDVQNIGSSL